MLGKRNDGYHEVATVLQTIDLSDSIQIETVEGSDISLEITGRAVAAGEDNLLCKTARLLREHAGCRRGVTMRLDKRVPVGAGLGGGSANAALLLPALNRLWELGLNGAELVELAARIGSDVPFFLTGGTVLARGRGELLTSLPDAPPAELLLLYPGFEISARDAYRRGGWGPLDRVSELTRRQVDTKISRFCGRVEKGLDVFDLAENDFDDLLFSEYPVLAEARESLQRVGCRRVLLCGSGSTLLGLAARSRLDEARRIVGRTGELLLCRTLSRSRYREILRQSGLDWEYSGPAQK